jgi:D-beta-D-heptose 7-phosphate kinase/D-beta-D-heptose 1-phosphate adenosyltransferase
MDVIVIGDIMLDINYYSYIYRNAPEANIPIHNIHHIDYLLGGAANIAHNLSNLNLSIELLSVIGNDETGIKLKTLLDHKKIKHKLFMDNERVTTQKNRIFNKNNLNIRYDIEDTKNINNEIANNLFDYIKNKKVKVIILSDYDKGVLTENLVKNIIEYSNNNNIYTFIDPKVKNFLKYKNCFCFKPNFYEAQEISKKTDVQDMIEFIKENINCKNLVLTLGKDGIMLNNINNHIFHKEDIKVTDVTGSGDIVLSILVYIFLSKKDLLLACKIANYIAGISVQVIGNYSLSKNDINNYYLNNPDSKIIYDTEISKIIELSKIENLVFTNGCFDILHSAHIQLLQYSKKQGDILVVGLNSDESIKRIKGEKRPINNQEERIKILSLFDFIDYIIVFNDDTPFNILKMLKPKILVKGSDYLIETIIGREFCKEIKLFNYIENKSTSLIINKIQKKSNINAI